MQNENPKNCIIKAGRGSIASMLAEAWHAREILWFLLWRTLKVRYKQTALGVSWAVLQPVINMLVFTLVFNRMAGIKAGDVPYPVFVFAGLLPWTLFKESLQRASMSVVGEAAIIGKVYFPRVLIPASAVCSAVVDFLISLSVLFLLIIVYSYSFSIKMLFIPLICLYAVVIAMAVSLWLSALNVRFRDVRYIIPFAMQCWLFLSPVAYPSEKIIGTIPPDWQWLYYLNPLVGVVDGFRWTIIDNVAPNTGGILLSAAVVVALFATGLSYFRHVERTMADLI